MSIIVYFVRVNLADNIRDLRFVLIRFSAGQNMVSRTHIVA